MDISGRVIQFFGLFDWLIVVNHRKSRAFFRFGWRNGGCGRWCRHIEEACGLLGTITGPMR
jgi:hypothetical protein